MIGVQEVEMEKALRQKILKILMLLILHKRKGETRRPLGKSRWFKILTKWKLIIQLKFWVWKLPIWQKIRLLNRNWSKRALLSFMMIQVLCIM